MDDPVDDLVDDLVNDPVDGPVDGPVDEPVELFGRGGSMSESRRHELLGMKLRALVGDHLGRVPDEPAGGFANGAAILVGGDAWVLIDGDAERALGGALALALRSGASALHVIAETHTGLLARRADRFTMPTTIWYPVERTLLAAVPEPLAEPPQPSARHLEFRPVIEGAGATSFVEHGVVGGDVRGLEVCRVVDTPTTGYFDDPDGGPPISAMAPSDAVMVEVGVGGPDREAFRIIHGDIPTVEALTSVVSAVEAHRSTTADPHPLNRLAPERFLRWRLQQEPALALLRSVEPIEPPLPRRGLNEMAPCVARGVDADGRYTSLDGEVTVVCSVGVDLDLIPYVADVQAMVELREMVNRPVVVALPRRDLLPITMAIAELLRTPVSFVAID